MRKIPFLRLCIILILGIFFNSYLEGYIGMKYFSFLASIMILSIFYFYSRKFLTCIIPYGLSLLAFVLCLGSFTAELHRIDNNKSHYSLHLSDACNARIIEAKIASKSKKNNRTIFDLEVKGLQVSDTSIIDVSGLIQIICLDDQGIEIADKIKLKGDLQEFNAISNKYTFDYKAFQKRKHKIHQIYKPEILDVIKKKSWLVNFRERSKSKMDSLNLSQTSISVLYAMILGDKSKISDIESIFRSTGTSHVLAISGLHIGIIATLLNFLLSFFKGKWSWIKYLLIIIGSWIFCLISGAAPSTVRACIMVTCYFTSKLINEEANGFNFCFIAAFFMLILDPNQIYDIGFQFSFLAILGILLFYKPFYKVIILRGFYDKLWQMSVMTIAAQIALTPLSLYYFHEFPLLFLPASLVAIPVTFIIISLAVFTMTINFMMSEPVWLSKILNWLIETFMSFLEILANIDGMVITGLNPSFWEVGLYYLIIFGLTAYFHFKAKLGKFIFMLSFLSLIITQFSINHSFLEKQLVIYAHYKNIHLDVISSGTAYSFDEMNASKSKADWFRKPYHLQRNVKFLEFANISDRENQVFHILDKSILILNRDMDLEEEYDFILINTPIDHLDCFPNNSTIIDFGNNKKLRKEHSHILFNHQIIIIK